VPDCAALPTTRTVSADGLVAEEGAEGVEADKLNDAIISPESIRVPDWW